MKFKVTFLLLALGYTFTIYAQTTVDQKVGSLDSGNNEKAQLQLTTSIIKQVSCAPNDMRFTLKLIFRNIGQKPIILNKKYLMGGVWVSRDVEAAAAEKYETYLQYSFVGSDEGLEPPVFSDFLILKPGEVYEREDQAGFLTNYVTPEAGGYFQPGTHVLQIAVGTWPYTVGDEPYRSEWRDKGFLWSQGMMSVPMPFSFKLDRPISNCSTVMNVN